MFRIVHSILFLIRVELELINEQGYMFKLDSFNCQTNSSYSRAT